MRLSTRIFGLGLLAMAFLCAAGSAEAASFADYVYQNAKTGNIAGIKNYLRRGYSIDAVSPNGYTALCFAVDNNDYRAYSRIRNLGADETHSCMRRVNADNAADLAQRYDAVAANSGRTAFAGGSDDTMKYVAAGAAVAGAATAVALWADDDGGEFFRRGKSLRYGGRVCRRGMPADRMSGRQPFGGQRMCGRRRVPDGTEDGRRPVRADSLSSEYPFAGKFVRC